MRSACGARGSGDGVIVGRSLATASQIPPRGRTKAPEGTGGDLRSTGPAAANKSAVTGRRRVPRSPALRPANLVPGAVRGITPPTGLAVQPAPSGKTKITGAPFAATMGLSTNLSRNRENLSPTSGLMWMVCGYTRGGGTAHGSSACPHHDRAGWLGSTVR
jgi:hypothetical protein